MEIFNNTTKIIKEDLEKNIMKDSRISIAAACFSMYAFQELKNQLSQIKSFRFIFTSPTFITEKTAKEKREFYIPRIEREKSIHGSRFEVKLRNELTQKAIAKECAEWVREKVTFKSNITNESMGGFMNIEHSKDTVTYMPINGFTTVDIGCERGNNTYNMVTKFESPHSKEFISLFNSLWNDKSKLQDVTDEVISSITTAYNENPPDFIYFITLFNIFNEFLEDISEDVLPNEATGFKNSKIWEILYSFQKDAALAIINKLEKYNGCILADSVGLGKTFTALAVIKYYENRNKSVLVLCPKKLSDNWDTFKANYVNNPIAKDRLRYDVLYHTDLSRDSGKSNGLDLDRLNWGNYDLLVIDESHNFRNGGELSGEAGDKENRYLRLLNKVIRAGVKTKVLMLSATPVNNKFLDLKNQLALAYEGNAEVINAKLNTTKSIDEIFRTAQQAFNEWSKLSPLYRTTDELLKKLDFDFFELLDSVTIARSRKHIEKYYDMAELGEFPERLKPISLRPNLTDLDSAINYNQIYEQLMQLNLSIYTPSNFIHESKKYKYMSLAEIEEANLTQAGREQGIRRLMSINLLKRLESSVFSFRLTLTRVLKIINEAIDLINQYEENRSVDLETLDMRYLDDMDYEEQNTDIFIVGGKIKIDIADMDYVSWRDDLTKDKDTIGLLVLMIEEIVPQHDIKLQSLLKTISNKINNPINGRNKKILIFTAFADTASYLYDHVSAFAKKNFGLDTAMITGSVEGRSTVPKLKTDFNTVLTCFSPISKEKNLLVPNSKIEIDILVATDCISEGQNLQDCDYLVNYDIHWNPVRIIQRFGRIDRIGSQNNFIQLVNFWPDLTLDEYINLKARVETKMKISVLTSTGDDNLLSVEEKGDLEYRKQQLKRLQEEVVDIEDISGGISIMDLGLNEFRMDLLEYIKDNSEIERAPFGMHALVGATEDTPPGVIYVLKNINSGVNVDSQNRLHPFYMIYITNDGEVVCDHTEPKKMLDIMRLLCKNKQEPEKNLCRAFNKETKDGKDMRRFSELLSKAINSIVEVKEEKDIDSFFKNGAQVFFSNEIKGLDDFELICFLVVK